VTMSFASSRDIDPKVPVKTNESPARGPAPGCASTDSDAARTQGSGPRASQQPGLVVQSGGHMRAFFGRAYIPQMLPRGISAAEIQ